MSTPIDQGTATVIAACIALGGVVIGFISSQITEIFRVSREAKMRQKEKILDRMISAHERVLDAAGRMSTVVVVDNPDELELPSDTERPVRAVAVLMSTDTFEQWWGNIFYPALTSEAWLSLEVRREMNYVQDYLVNLNSLVESFDAQQLRTLSIIIRQDFIDMSGDLKSLATTYLTTEAAKLKTPLKHKKWHKYKKSATIGRLNGTELFKHYFNDLNSEK